MTTKKPYGLEELERDFGPLTFGDLVSSHRLGENMSQVEMAKFLGISKQSLNDIEKGRAFPSLSRAIRIAKKIELSTIVAIETLIQDQLRREKLKFNVKLERIRGKTA